MGGTDFVMRDRHVFTSTDETTFTDRGAEMSLANSPRADSDAWGGKVGPGANDTYYWSVPVNGNGPGWTDIGGTVGDTPLDPSTDAEGGPFRFDDDLGIESSSCQVHDWNGSAHVDAAGQSSCSGRANTFDETTFNPVSTSRIRLSVTSKSGYSTRIQEWRALL
jgi:hypothetical protein